MANNDDSSSGKQRVTASGLRQRALWRAVLVGAVLVASAVGGWLWWSWYRAEAEFQRQADLGQAALDDVETLPDAGREHVSPGEQVQYGSDPPTSGPHDPTPGEPGFYDEVQPPEMLVHSLEHGHIVIYYDQPSAEALQTLKKWAGRYTGHWDGVIVTPRPGLGQTVILTAWTKMLHLDPFRTDAAAAFIDAFRGRGPENPVR